MNLNKATIDAMNALTPEALRDIVDRLLSGNISVATGLGYFPEEPERVISALLDSESILLQTRELVLKECESTYARAFANWGRIIDPTIDRDGELARLIRLSNVVDFSRPKELRPSAESILWKSLLTDQMGTRVLDALVRAARAYVTRGDEHRVPLWLEVCRVPSIASHGFSALLQIDPHDSRIDRLLIELEKRARLEAWPVDYAFLQRRTMLARRPQPTDFKSVSGRSLKRNLQPTVDYLGSFSDTPIYHGRTVMLPTPLNERAGVVSSNVVVKWKRDKVVALFEDIEEIRVQNPAIMMGNDGTFTAFIAGLPPVRPRTVTYSKTLEELA